MTDERMTCCLKGARRAARLLPVLVAALLSACATTTKTTEAPKTVSHVEVQEDVGFTITEDVEIDAAVRLDYEEALRYMEQSRYDEGIALLSTVVAAAPHVSAPLIDLGIAYHRTGDLEKAEEYLRKAIELNPNHPTAYNELGIVLRETGRFAEARQSYESALAIYPGYHFARRNLAILCDLYLADPECALDNYEAYMKTVPGDDEAEIWIADLKARTGR